MEIIYEPYKKLPLSEFQEELRFEFPDLPVQLFDYYLVRTAREMAKKGNLIRRKAIVHLQCGVTRYVLEAPDGMEICGILGARINQNCSCFNKEARRTFVAPEGSQSCRSNMVWFDDAENVLHVNTPFIESALYVTLAVTPAKGDCELPDKYMDFLPTLMMGTRAQLLLLTGRPWTNLALGQAYYNEFLKQIQELAIDVSTHKMRGSVKMNFGRVL